MLMTLLNVLGDIKKVFVWLGGKQGQQVIATGEAIAEALYPPATGIISIANGWLTEIIKTEAIATAAGAEKGSGTQKSAMVIAAESPQLIAFAQQHGLSNPTADQMQKANDALVAFLNAFEPKP
jgi:hypothetical protein